MIDREKVIRHITAEIGIAKLCKKDFASVDIDMLSDTLALLKENETKTGTWQWKIHGKAESGWTLGEAICDQCGESTYATAVKGDLNYCPNCGAKMRRLKAVK